MDQVDKNAPGPKIEQELKDALASLQDVMAMVDLSIRPSRGRQSGMELLLKEHRLLRIKMDGNRNHQRPHLHIDYHRRHHLASYAIDDGSRLSGTVGTYDRVIQRWFEENRVLLMKAWEGLRSSLGVDGVVVAELRGSSVGG